MKRSTVQCLHVMTTHGEEFWHPLLETGFEQKKNFFFRNLYIYIFFTVKRWY
jgi:hypothetical protein